MLTRADKNAPKIWIDCDVALSAPRGDVDDGFALAAAALSPGVVLCGVSTVFGNTSAALAHRAARRLLQVLHRADVPLFLGAGRPGEGVPAVCEALARLPEGSELLCLGPLTNVAAALRRDPDLAHRVTLSIVGGNLRSWGRFPPYWPFEFNLAKDPAATATVFASPVRRRLFPLPLCARLRIGPLYLARLAASSPAGRYLARHSLRWLLRTPLRYQSLRFPLWDLVPTLHVLGHVPMDFMQRRLRPYGRGGLREDALAPVSECATGFDPDRARRVFLALCG